MARRTTETYIDIGRRRVVAVAIECPAGTLPAAIIAGLAAAEGDIAARDGLLTHLQRWPHQKPIIRAALAEQLHVEGRPGSVELAAAIVGDRAPDLAWRTLADVDDSPPGELIAGMLEPDGPTLLYGAGGIGKGTTAAWLIRECLALGVRPLVYDAEIHPREWRRRTAGLDVPPERVVYVQPADLPADLQGLPLHNVVPWLGKIARAAGCGMLYIDSILAAANLTEDGMRSDARAPYRVVSALGELSMPSVSLGHPAKGAAEGEPYGSVAWTNAMRLCWLGSRAEGEGHRIRWTPRKRNERGQIPAILLTCEYDESGRLCGVRREDDEQATRAWLTATLETGPRTVDELAEEMIELDDGPREPALARAKDRIRQTLGRMRRAGRAHKTGGRGAPWALGASARVSRVSRNGQRDTEDD